MNSTEILFALLAYAVGERETCPAVTAADLPTLYDMASRHDMAHLLCSALDKSGQMPETGLSEETDETAKNLKKQKSLSVFRAENIGFECEQLAKVLEDGGIDFVLLKGAVIRPLYPASWMRTSCDIDVLVREQDLEQAAACLCEGLEATAGQRESHDLSLYTQSGVHIELHFCLDEYLPKADGILSQVWEDVLPEEGKSHAYRMTPGMFYLYHVAHMAKHVLHGGCGIRPFLDMYLLNKREDYRSAKGQAMLEESGLSAFEEVARHLSRVWFAGEEHTAVTGRLETYLLEGGLYGTSDNRMAVESKRLGKGKYLLSRLFMPYDQLKVQYPVLYKHKWLYPVCQVRRWGSKLRKGRVAKETRKLKDLSAKGDGGTTALVKDLGL